MRYNANVARHVIHKTQRWALRLSEFNFTIEHILGEDNVWADILPALPNLEVISESQKKYPPPNGSGLKKSGELQLWKNSEGKLYIPEEDEALQLRICVSAHCGCGAHLGIGPTTDIIKDKLVWSTMHSDIKSLVQSCIVCVLCSIGSKVLRPLGQQLHSKEVSELLHFDFLYTGESSTGEEYILILKDDFYGYVYLRACKNSDAARVLTEYFSTFVPVLNWFLTMDLTSSTNL